MVFENYAARERISAAPITSEILDFFDDWRSASALARALPQFSARSLERAVAALVRAGMLESSRNAHANKSSPFDAWEKWGPAAGYFHFSTKDTNVPTEPEDSIRALRRRARARPMPRAVKSYPRSRKLLLPKPDTSGDLAGALLERRTWRKFAPGEIEFEKIATLLGLTFGVQWWLDMKGVGRIALKTSPSGGSRHPIEAYLLAMRVKGVPRGLYHYDAGAHQLELLRRGAAPAQIRRYLNGQWWFDGAGAVVLMTAVFARTQWKYEAPRAYRAVLMEAGHVCQTFCLVATWLGLAPFCTIALADSKIERDLGIDGASESVLYAAGVGQRSPKKDWAPWPGSAYGKRVPNLAR